MYIYNVCIYQQNVIMIVAAYAHCCHKYVLLKLTSKKLE